jgi:hypothetical protein
MSAPSVHRTFAFTTLTASFVSFVNCSTLVRTTAVQVTDCDIMSIVRTCCRLTTFLFQYVERIDMLSRHLDTIHRSGVILGDDEEQKFR